MAKKERSKSVSLLNEEQIEKLLAHLSHWHLQLVDSHPRLVKNYKCEHFAAAMLFANQIANMAELENHHPRLLVEYKRVQISWWSHEPVGLTEMDFLMAARCDELAERNTG
ncbi:MAG: Putative pterin-4-alpha-carbinolamine dehydratase [Candidatus Celerinatantimonas neptuna]|nr:MAG: Putative pterin-4-alpha-carbinolamine dehydratase [Candidatus Celerinatantimonas neptuna]